MLITGFLHIIFLYSLNDPIDIKISLSIALYGKHILSKILPQKNRVYKKTHKIAALLSFAFMDDFRIIVR